MQMMCTGAGWSLVAFVKLVCCQGETRSLCGPSKLGYSFLSEPTSAFLQKGVALCVG